MPDPINGRFLSADELSKAWRLRKKKVVYETVTSTSKEPEILQTKLKEKYSDGWRQVRELKHGYKLEKDKPLDEQLEDEAWALLAGMGFPHLSEGRQFKAKLDGSFRQLDVVGVDTESVVIVECRQAEKPDTRRSMTDLIEKIASLHGQKATHKIFKKHFQNNNLQVSSIIVTRRIRWPEEDIKRAGNHGIAVIRDEQIDYFVKLVAHLKQAARFQFLAHVCRDKEIPGLRLEVPATKASIGKKPFYSCLVKVSDLLRIAYVSHKASKSLSMGTYQRLAVPKRLKDIAKFIDKDDFGGTFPTNVVLSLHGKKKPRFDAKTSVGTVKVGTLYLPAVYGSAFVVDGQHRLFGYAHSKRCQKKDDETAFSVLAYVDLDSQAEAQMFVDINSEQKQVAKGLLDELSATLHWDAPEKQSQRQALASKLVQELNSTIGSKLKGRIKLTGEKASSTRCLTITQLAEPLIRNKLLGQTLQNGQDTPGPLCDTRRGEESLEAHEKKAYECLEGLFNFVAETGPRQFSLGNAAGGYLWTNGGVRPLIGVLAHILRHIERRDEHVVHSEPPEEFMPTVHNLLKPVVLHFEEGAQEAAQAFRDRTSMKGVTTNEFEMMRIIKANESSFTAVGLEDYVANLDEKGTKEARGLIDELELRMYDHVLKKLRQKYGEKKIGGMPVWFREGVHVDIRTEIRNKQDREQRPKEFPWQYFSLIHFREIVIFKDHWTTMFEKAFTFEGQKGKKTDRTKWIVHLNTIRNTTHHAIKGVITHEEVLTVKGIHKHVMNNMKVDEAP